MITLHPRKIAGIALLSFIGATFPNGATAPHLALRLPE